MHGLCEAKEGGSRSAATAVHLLGRMLGAVIAMEPGLVDQVLSGLEGAQGVHLGAWLGVVDAAARYEADVLCSGQHAARAHEVAVRCLSHGAVPDARKAAAFLIDALYQHGYVGADNVHRTLDVGDGVLHDS